MTFLGLENPVVYQDQEIFNPVTAQMVLNANKDYINAVYQDYLRGIQEMKEFNEKYGDFISPIQKDMEWYYDNVTGNIRNFINDLYARGIDPLRSVEGRALVARKLATMPINGISQVRQSAKTANEFLAAKQDLQRKGLYDPILAKYEGIDMSEYSTMGDKDAGIEAMGVWDRTSPTPIQNVAEFGNPYFEGMKPSVHRRSKNGITYSEESITMDDLKAIADSKYNELVRTPQGQLMYKYYRDLTGSDEAARNMFNEAIANGQQRRTTYVKDDYEDNYFKHRQLALEAERNQLARQKFNYERQKDAAEALERNGVSQWEQNYNDALANAASDSYTKYDPSTVNQHYEAIGKTLNSTQKYFGSGLKNDAPLVRDEKFKNRYTKPADVIGILKAHGGYKEGESSVLLNRSDILRLRSEEDVITNTQGNYSKRTRTSKAIQDKVRDALKDGTKTVRMYPYGVKYGAQSKDNVFDIDAPADIVIIDAEGNIEEKLDNVYWDTRWGNRESLYHKDPGPDSQFRTESSVILNDDVQTNAFPSMWGASSVLPSDTRGTKADYAASPSVKLGNSYK